ncbi:uncharacterized protein LOC119672625 [Teleopsis dalmanni]|uniref:uncharacterized protein LOC119672625 n=1 Tax=Teleopsis dalmanni TaxID=139649 RepID=UPI000D32CE82|nr:uncharacterized protein LOC119672625 [Teleopsis dalmanni]
MFPSNKKIIAVKEEALPPKQNVHQLLGETVIETYQDFRTTIESQNISVCKILPNGQRIEVDSNQVPTQGNIVNLGNTTVTPQYVINQNIIPTANCLVPNEQPLLPRKPTLQELLSIENRLPRPSPPFPLTYSVGTSTH